MDYKWNHALNFEANWLGLITELALSYDITEVTEDQWYDLKTKLITTNYNSILLIHANFVDDLEINLF